MKKQVEEAITGEDEDEKEVATTVEDVEATAARKKKDASQTHVFQVS